jgi:tetratricopeptide (TPR) repeat protein
MFKWRPIRFGSFTRPHRKPGANANPRNHAPQEPGVRDAGALLTDAIDSRDSAQFLRSESSPFFCKAQEMTGRWFDKSTVRSLTGGLVLLCCMMQAFAADGSSQTAADDETRRAAAVALNYSRAALHHIRQNPSKRVLYEEQEKILNHLNLNGVADEEVLKLYSAVLDEISQIQIADREKAFLKDRFRHQFRSQMTAQAFNLAADVATAQYVNAVRTGANSWWDYRNISVNHDLDQWRVEKQRLTAVVDKSSQFLDTSWKMARAKQIPDRWLVRNDDLDRLEDAWKESNPTVRLRVLKRMEPFMECYPPYWYYVARTQQSLGQLTAAVETYQKLAKLGTGHFRKDEMLAAGLANQALIQAHLQLPGAAESARQALLHSTDVWEANLVCAAVLQREGHFDDAEDAILRNLDVDLERSQSRIALLGLYCQSHNVEKLTAQLRDPEVIRDVPAPILLACAQAAGDPQITAAVVAQLQSTLQAAPRFNLGRDDLVLTAAPNWQLQNATVMLRWGDKNYRKPRVAAQKDSTLISFDGIGEFGSLFAQMPNQPDLAVTLTYPDFPPVTLHLSARDAAERDADASHKSAGRYPVYRLATFEAVGGPKSSLASPKPSTGRTAAKVVSEESSPSADDSLPADAMIDAELVTPAIEIRGK